MFNYAFNIQLLFNTSTRYSIFNFTFNIQLFILYSIPYSAIQLSIQQFQPFIQHSTLIQHSTIHSTLLSPHYFWSVTQSDFPRFLDSVFQRTDQIFQTKVDEEILEQHNVIVDQTVRLLRVPRYTPRQQFEY